MRSGTRLSGTSVGIPRDFQDGKRENARLLIPDAEYLASGKAAIARWPDSSRLNILAKYSVGRERRPGGNRNATRVGRFSARCRENEKRRSSPCHETKRYDTKSVTYDYKFQRAASFLYRQQSKRALRRRAHFILISDRLSPLTIILSLNAASKYPRGRFTSFAG